MTKHRLPKLSRPWGDAKAMRRAFRQSVIHGLWVTWPIISIHMLLMVALGVMVGVLEGWTFSEGVYFSFITGYAVGYGQFTPSYFGTRMLAVLIATVGISLTGVMASVAVRALHHAMPLEDREDE